MLKKLLAKKLTPHQVNQLVEPVLSQLVKLPNLKLVYLFGSAARGQMTDMSDLDFAAIFDDQANLRTIKKAFYTSPRATHCSIDLLFFHQTDFNQRAEVGGIPMICIKEGVVLYDERTAI